MADEPRVCIIIVSYNSAATLPECFAGLERQTYRDFRVVLVDNKSDQRPTRLIEGLTYPVTYLEMDENLGFAEGMNRGIAATTSPLIVALNPDAYAQPDWLENLVAAAERHADIAAFGSLQLSANDPNRIDGFGDHYLVTGQAWRGETIPPAPASGGPEYTFGVCAAAALYRADALRAAGGYDRRFFCFYEDVDLAFRLRLMGHQCAVIRTAVVRHVGGASFEGKSDFAEFLIARNAWWTLLKNMPALLLPIAAVGFLAINLISALRGRSPARRRGFWEGLKQTSTFWAARHEVQAKRIASAAEVARWLTWRPGAFLSKRAITQPRSAPSRR